MGRRNWQKNVGATNNSNNNNSPIFFKMNDKLRTALCTQGQFTPERFEETIESPRIF